VLKQKPLRQLRQLWGNEIGFQIKKSQNACYNLRIASNWKKRLPQWNLRLFSVALIISTVGLTQSQQPQNAIKTFWYVIVGQKSRQYWYQNQYLGFQKLVATFAPAAGSDH
jgi:hypothetical protein